MRKRKKREPVEEVWRSGPAFRAGQDPPSPYKTIMDFQIALVPDKFHGLLMEWRSATLGLLTPLMWPIHLEDPDQPHGQEGGLLRDGWRPVGTPDNVVSEIDQGFLFVSWADDRFVYVEYGADEEGQTYSTWYRVLRPVFDQAWNDMLRRLEAIPRPADAASG